MDKKFAEIKEKVYGHVRLSREEGIFLYEYPDLLAVAELARFRKEEVSGKNVFFNVNRHINLTNICISRCKFCAFGVDENGSGGPYIMSPEEAFNFGAEAVERGITEFHVVSAMHPKMGLDYYIEVLRRLHEAYPHIHIQAFTAVEIFHMHKISGLPVREVLQLLRDAGLGSIPGGGAEVFNDEIRQKLCPRKATTQEWLEVHRIAHQMGIKTNCTMLFGHIESIADRVEHFIKLRELQDEAPGFQAFVALPFLPEHTQMEYIPRTTAVDELKTIALARLMLDNIPHIKAFWIMLGMPTAQISLHFGADDMDGTVVEERIMHAAGVATEKGIAKDELVRLIKDAGYVPVERDTVYNILKVF